MIRIFPNKKSAWRLLGPLPAEQHEEWITECRYFDMEECHEWKTARQGAEHKGQGA